MKSLSLLLGLFLGLAVAPAAHAQLIVGNLGGGVFSGGHLYVRDLYDAGRHLTPYVGDDVLTGLRRRSEQLRMLSGLDVDRELLLRKLTDAEALQAGWGYALMTTIEFYRWYLIDQELATIPDEAPIYVMPGDSYVALANRLKTSIRLNRAHFARLSPEHRAALILHEAIYAMVKVQCDGAGGNCLQSAVAVRDLNAALFSDPADTCPPERRGDCLGTRLARLLDVDWSAGDCLGTAANEIHYQVARPGQGGEPAKRRALAFDETGDTRLQTRRFAQVICAEAFPNPLRPAKLAVMVEMRRSPMTFEFRDYRTPLPDSVDNVQVALRGVARPWERIDYSAPTDWSSCIDQIEERLNGWYDGSDYPTLESAHGIAPFPGRQGAPVYLGVCGIPRRFPEAAPSGPATDDPRPSP